VTKRAQKNGKPPWTKPLPERAKGAPKRTRRELLLWELEGQGSEDASNHFDAGDYVDASLDLDTATDEMQNKAATEIIDDIINGMDLKSWAAQVELDDEEPDEEMMQAWIRGWRPRAFHRLRVAIQTLHNETAAALELYYLIDGMDEDGDFSKTFLLDILQERENYTIVDRGSFDDMLNLLARLSSLGAIALGNGHYPILPLFWAVPAENNLLYFAGNDHALDRTTQREASDEILRLGGENAIWRRYEDQLDELARRGYVWKSSTGNKYEMRRKRPGDFPTPVTERKNPARRRGAR